MKVNRTQKRLESLVADLEGALKLVLLEVGDLKKTAAKTPDRLLPRLEALEALAEEAKALASKAYALGAELRREEEDNSAETLRALFGLEAR
jgi:hypothetical protein